MSFNELLRYQHEAGEALGLEPETRQEIIESQRTTVIDLGEIVIETDDGGTRAMHAWRGHSGPEDSMKKGGSRLTVTNPLRDAEELPFEMITKNAVGDLTDADGKPVGGGKLIIEADPASLSHHEKIRTFIGAADRMKAAEILGYEKSIPAGDMGTNHPDYMDGYAYRAHELRPDDPYWQATITGKSVANGGLAFRPHATGYGVYQAAEYGRRQRGMETADVTISGAGNVGGWTGYFMSQTLEDDAKPYRITGYGDRYSTLQIADQSPGAPGIHINKFIAEEILDNPNFAYDPRFTAFNGDKLLALAAHLQQHQPNVEFVVSNNPGNILKAPSDIFVAASVGGLITEQTVKLIEAPIVVEGGNGPTTQAGYYAGLRTGKLFVVDIESNTGGVEASMVEVIGNVNQVRSGTPMPTYDEARALATARSFRRHAQVARMGELLGVQGDRRLAANALGMATMALNSGVSLAREFADLILAERQKTAALVG